MGKMGKKGKMCKKNNKPIKLYEKNIKVNKVK